MPEYSPGDYVDVRFGRAGSQVARIESFEPEGRYRLRKYRRNSRTWTGVVRVPPGEVLGLTNYRKLRDIPAAPASEAKRMPAELI